MENKVGTTLPSTLCTKYPQLIWVCLKVMYLRIYVYSSGWWFGTCFIFPYIGNVIIPTDELIFFRGVGIPPTGPLLITINN